MIHPSEGTLDVLTLLLLYVDYFTLILEEAAYIPSSDDSIEVENFFALSVRTGVLKGGVCGFYLIKRDSVHHVPACVLRASDFIGNGDAYCGNFIGVWRAACRRWGGLPNGLCRRCPRREGLGLGCRGDGVGKDVAGY